MIAAFVRNPVKVIVGVMLVALFGVIGLYRMPTQLTPEVQIPTITIETRWPGASPQEVERQIVMEQEEQLKSVEGVTKMTSECMDSMGRITLEFPVGTDMRQALLLVNTRLQQVPEYPEDADEPIIATTNSGDRPIAWFILKPRAPTPDEIAEYQAAHPELKEPLERVRAARNAGLRLYRLREVVKQYPAAQELMPPVLDVTTYRKFAEDFIEARLERVPGVANANVLGGRTEEMQVIVDPQKLASRKLTIQHVREALRATNKDTSAGDIWEGKRRYIIRTLGQFRTEEQVREVIVARVDGVSVKVRDVAEVKLGYRKPDGLVRQFGTDCIAINAQRSVGANVLEVMAGLRQANQEINERLLKPRGLILEQVYDETEYITSAIGLVEDNIIVGGILTTIVLLIFLRSARSTFVIALAIPTSIVGTFLVMSLLGRSLNVVSLAGLAFAVGMLVDNAVVVLENIYQHYQKGKGPFEAAVDGAAEVWGAILSSTLTTLSVFLPILFIAEEAGQLFRDIAIAISAGVALSLIVSLTLIPMMSARLLSPHSNGDGTTNGSHAETGTESVILTTIMKPLTIFGAAFSHSVVWINQWFLRGVIRRAVLTMGFMAISVYGSWKLLPKVEYLPNGNQNLVFGILLPPPAYNLDQLTAMGTKVEEALRPYWDVDANDPKAKDLDFPPLKDFFFVARGRQVFMGLKCSDDQRVGELVGLVRKVASGEPGTFAIGKQASLFEQGLTAGRTIDIEITGPELPVLVGLGGRILGQVMQLIPSAQVIPQPSLDLSAPEIHVVPRWEQAYDVGMTTTELGYAVNALVDGAYAGNYYRDGIKIDLTIVGSADFIRRTQDLELLSLATPSGELVPLGAVAEIQLRSGPEQINRRQRQRAITIQVAPPPNMPLEDAIQKIESEILAPLRQTPELKTGMYQINTAGTADKLRSIWKALSFNVLLALLITYLLMAALFESWVYPFVVIFSVPLGAVGGFVGLWLLNQFVLAPLDVLTMLGFVVLIGTVVNNPILIVEQALILIRQEGMSYAVAVVQAVRSRIRPIFMTTLTTLFGLLPLVLFPGAGSELYRGLGAVLLGGLLVSTIVTLIIIPAVFTLTLEIIEGGRRTVGRLRGSTASGQTPTQEKEKSG